MNKEQFLNRVQAGCNEVHNRQLEQYFHDYQGPFDEGSADEYVRFFNNDPKALRDNLERGTSHRESLMQNGMLQINSPL